MFASFWCATRGRRARTPSAFLPQQGKLSVESLVRDEDVVEAAAPVPFRPAEEDHVDADLPADRARAALPRAVGKHPAVVLRAVLAAIKQAVVLAERRE